MDEWDTQWDGPRPFDQEVADLYVGKYILIGLTYLDPAGEVTHQVQMHGIVEAADPTGITVSLRGHHSGEPCVLPPDLDAIEFAAPGTYTLRSTGEAIVDPDLVTTWTIRSPEEH